MPNEAPQPLLEPHRLGDLLLPNRVVMAPLTRGRANNPGHVPNELMRQYYEQRATAGLIISEGIWVSEDGQGWLGAPGIYNREQGGRLESNNRCRSCEGWPHLCPALAPGSRFAPLLLL